jgi:hypothetical protein
MDMHNGTISLIYTIATMVIFTYFAMIWKKDDLLNKIVLLWYVFLAGAFAFALLFSLETWMVISATITLGVFGIFWSRKDTYNIIVKIVMLLLTFIGIAILIGKVW